MPRGKPLIDLTNRRFGNWLVIRRYEHDYVSGVEGNYHYIPRWVCKCDCGTTGIVTGNNLRSGASTCCHKCRDDKRTAGLRAYHRANRMGKRGAVVCERRD